MPGEQQPKFNQTKLTHTTGKENNCFNRTIVYALDAFAYRRSQELVVKVKHIPGADIPILLASAVLGKAEKLITMYERYFNRQSVSMEAVS